MKVKGWSFSVDFFKAYLAVNSVLIAYGVLNLFCNNWYFAVLFAHLALGVFTVAPLFFIKSGGYYTLCINIIFFISTLPAAVVMSLFGEMISSSAFFALFNTDSSETVEFIANYTYKIPIFLSFIVLALIFPIMFRKTNIYTENRAKYLALLLIPIFIVVFNADALKNSVFWRTKRAFTSYLNELEKLSLLREGKDKDIQFEAIGGDCNLIFVVGESASALHMGAYGYFRGTTSFTDKLPFIRLTGVTTDAHTIPAVLKMFNAYDEDNGSLQNVLTQSGYETYWISNQPTLGSGDTPIQAIASRVKYEKHIMRGQYDEKLIPLVQDAFKGGGVRKAVFVHLLGSHTGYSRRYPKEFSYFNDREGLKGFAVKHYREVNHYDNSIRYTDSLIARFAEIAAENNAVLIYIADHGEEVFDLSNFSGHTNGLISRYMSDVPFYILPAPVGSGCKEDLGVYYNRKEPVSTTSATYIVEDLLGVHPSGFSEIPHPLSYYDAENLLS
ncbi:MAG: phosphoethanolamine transferase, partial [Deferribacteraceae bacterium]|nr:phosphoethanolamine transferase [Deferribacteraceae bacterium]